MSKKNISVFSILNIVFLVLVSITMIFPFLWMLSTSFKYDSDAFKVPIEWIPSNPTISNYVKVWTQEPFLQFYCNTVIVVLFSTFFQVLLSSMAAYAFAKLEFIGKKVCFALITATMMIPWQVIMIPQYQLVSRLNLTNTLLVLILGQIASAFAIFLLRQFILSIPNELRESGIIDGAGEFTTFFRIMLPQVKPALATLIIFTFIHVWNDYLTPLIFINTEDKFTIQLGLQFFSSAYTMQYGVVMAGTVCSLIPIFLIFFLFQKQVTTGMVSVGIKG